MPRHRCDKEDWLRFIQSLTSAANSGEYLFACEKLVETNAPERCFDSRKMNGNSMGEWADLAAGYRGAMPLWMIPIGFLLYGFLVVVCWTYGGDYLSAMSHTRVSPKKIGDKVRDVCGCMYFLFGTILSWVAGFGGLMGGCAIIGRLVNSTFGIKDRSLLGVTFMGTIVLLPFWPVIRKVLTGLVRGVNET